MPETNSGDEEVEKFYEIAKKLKADASVYLDESFPGWECCRDSHGVLIQRAPDPDHHKGHVFKAECVIERDLDELAQIVHPLGPYRAIWDHFVNLKVLKRIGRNMTVEHVMLKHHLLGLIAPREMVHLVSFEAPSPSVRQNFAISIDYSECPMDHKIVRARTYPAAFRMEKLQSDPSSTKVTLIVRTDVKFPKIIPLAIIESGFPSEILRFFERLQHASKTISITEFHDLAGWTDRYAS